MGNRGSGGLRDWGIGALGHWGIGALGHWEEVETYTGFYHRISNSD